MNKGSLTGSYMKAWVVALIALAIGYLAGHSATPTHPLAGVAWAVALIDGLVMLATWIGVLILLGRMRSWGWFVAVSGLQLIGLGIIGMVAYAVAGPTEEMVVTRPTVSAG